MVTRGVHDTYCFCRRNVDGDMLQEFADPLDFADVHTWFKKRPETA